jgi:hypothetical protein
LEACHLIVLGDRDLDAEPREAVNEKVRSPKLALHEEESFAAPTVHLSMPSSSYLPDLRTLSSLAASVL